MVKRSNLVFVLLAGLGAATLAAVASGAGEAAAAGQAVRFKPVRTSSPRPLTPSLPAGEWTVIRPGGETTCARGTEYAYGVRGGTVNKVVIDFMGGGACWNDLTCSVAGSLFNETVDVDQLFGQAGHGIYDVTNPENPVRDWYHVFIPYCTGDVHWGDAVVDYGEGEDQFTIRHKGRTNARAVLDWVYASFPDPDAVFVTGCSAGAYGSIGWAPHIMRHYAGSKVYQMGDSGAGIITDDFFRMSFPSWNPYGIFPSFIPALDPRRNDVFSTDLSDFYSGVANYFPRNVVSMYDSNFDENQTFYYTAMGGLGGQRAWSERMRTLVAEAHEKSERFHSYTAPGDKHCIIPYDEFYDYTADGVRLVDWVRDLVNGKRVEKDVACQGDECGQPTDDS